MAETIKHKVEEAGQKVAEKATEVGHKVGEKVEEAADWAKEKAHQAGNRMEEAGQKVRHKVKTLAESTGSVGSPADIREHMEVYGSCGNLLGKVDHVEGDRIKLTKNDSPDGQHHYIPISWVALVHDHIHLTRDCGEAAREWQPG
jgi:hypothetical protein